VVTYNTVSVSGNNIFGNASGEVVNVRFTPASFYFDTVNNTEINAPVATATSNNAGAWTVSGIIDPTPAGSGLAWNLTVSDKGTGQTLYTANVQIAYANGSNQLWLALTPPPAPATTTSFLVTPGAQATAAGQFLTSTNAGSSVLSWNFGTNPLNVRNFQADPTGVLDSTAAINNAIAAATGNAAPATHSRAATNEVYLPTGVYKVTADLLIQSVQGFRFYGDGPEMTFLVASGSGFTTAVLNVDGSYAGRYEGFTIKGDGTEQVTNGINLTWTTAANRSTTGNKFQDIRMRNLNFVTGFSMAGVTNRQVDSTRLDCVVVGGQQTPGSWSNSGNWQKGFEFGNGTFANIYDQVLTRCDPSGCYYGFYNNVSSFSLNGSQPANNNIDFYMNPGAQSTVTSVQSQNCGSFLLAPSNFAPEPTSFNDCQVKTSLLNGAANAVVTLGGGTWNFNNFSAAALQVSASYVNGIIAITGSSASRLCFANFNNLCLRGPRTSAFTLSNAVVTVQNYENYEPTTGNYTTATGDPMSFNAGGIWTTVGGPGVLPQVNYITATGTTSYTIPASAQTLDVLVVGGGAGGSSGGFSAAGAASGGAAGGGGGVSRQQFSVAALTSPISVTVGAGGNGGAAVTSAGNGNGGSVGGSTTFGGYLWGQGGRGGSAGQGSAAAAAGGAGGVGTNVSGAGGSSLATAVVPTGATAQSTSGGGPGGSVVGTTVAAGSNGGTIANIASWANPSPGVLSITSATGFPATGGTINVAASGPTTAVVTYTGVSGNTLTGCAYVSGSPAGTVATGGQVSMAANGAGTTAPAMGTSSNSSTGGVAYGGASPTNGSAGAAQGDTAPGGGGGAGAVGAASSAQDGADARANSGAGGGGGGACQGGTTGGKGGVGGSGFALIIAYFQ
jgi:hypothetical protein